MQAAKWVISGHFCLHFWVRGQQSNFQANELRGFTVACAAHQPETELFVRLRQGGEVCFFSSSQLKIQTYNTQSPSNQPSQKRVKKKVSKRMGLQNKSTSHWEQLESLRIARQFWAPPVNRHNEPVQHFRQEGENRLSSNTLLHMWPYTHHPSGQWNCFS